MQNIFIDNINYKRLELNKKKIKKFKIRRSEYYD